MKRPALILVSSLAVLVARAASAHQDGTQIVGYSGLEPGRVCNTCHSGGPPTTFTVGGPDRIRPGATAHYTVTIANPEGVYGGIDIAPDNAQAKVAPTQATLVLVGNEIVHKARVPFDNGEVTFTFDMTAPATPGVVTIHTDGVAGHAIDTALGDTGGEATYRVTVDANAPELPGDAKPAGCSAGGESAQTEGIWAIGLAGMALLMRRRRAALARARR